MSGVTNEVQKIEGKYKKLDAELRKNELYAWEKENTEDIQFLIDTFKQQQEQIQRLEKTNKLYKERYTKLCEESDTDSIDKDKQIQAYQSLIHSIKHKLAFINVVEQKEVLVHELFDMINDSIYEPPK